MMRDLRATAPPRKPAGAEPPGREPTPAHAIRPVLTSHARQRAAEMGIPTKLVKAVLRDPQMTYPSKKYPGAIMACRGNLAVPYRETDVERVRLAITVLWHTPGVPWTRGDCEEE